MTLKQTPSQTVGPYFAYGLTPRQYGYPFSSLADGALAGPATEGRRIRLQGRVFDGAGEPVPDAMIELWQANAQGRYNHPADKRSDNLLDPDFKGFGRVGTDDLGSFVFATVKPGAVAEDQAPHLNLIVFMRGFLQSDYLEFLGLKQAWRGLQALLGGRPAAIQLFGSDRLVVVGVYRWVRHPMMAAGLLFLITSGPSLNNLIYAAMYATYMVIGGYYEERRMLRIFADDYRRYSARVGAFFPRLKAPKAD